VRGYEKAKLRNCRTRKPISMKFDLFDRIVKTQLQDEGILLIKQKLLEKDPRYDCFRKERKT
jgi:hypothetical protein